MPRLTKTELPRHTQAFERYVAMGPSRSYARLATELGIDVDTVKLWGRSFAWQERLDARDREVTNEVRTQSTRTAVVDRAKRRRAAEMGFVQWVNDLKAGKLKPKFSDIKDLVQMMETEDRQHDKSYLTSTSTPEQIVAFLDNLTTEELDAVLRLCAARGHIPGPVLVIPDNHSAPTFDEE